MARHKAEPGTQAHYIQARVDGEVYEYLAARAQEAGSMSEALRQAVIFAKLAQQSASSGQPVPTTPEEADRFADAE